MGIKLPSWLRGYRHIFPGGGGELLVSCGDYWILHHCHYFFAYKMTMLATGCSSKYIRIYFHLLLTGRSQHGQRK